MTSIPYDDMLERQVLRDALNDQAVATAYAEQLELTRDHFYGSASRAIWGLIARRLASASGPLDLHVARTMLLEHPDLLDRGCSSDQVIDHLGDVLALPPTSGNVEHVVTLAALRTRRLVIAAAHQTIDEASNPAASVDELAARATERLAGSDLRPSVGDGVTMADALMQGIEQWEQPPTAADRRYVETQIASLDRVIGGLEKGRLITVAGRPGMGKSVLGLSFSRVVAVSTDLPVAHYSLEMPPVELAGRYAAATGVATLAGITGKDERAHAAIDWSRLLDLPNEAAAGRLTVFEKRQASTVSQVVASARRLHSTSGGLGLVVVDYIGLLLPDDRRITNRVQQIGHIVTALKDLAMDLDVPVVALAQLNRSIETRLVKVPELSDLRESGDIEQASDQVILVNRPEVYAPEKRVGEADLIVAKNRAGERGTAAVAFDGPHVRFRPLAGGPQAPPPRTAASAPYPDIPFPEAA